MKTKFKHKIEFHSKQGFTALICLPDCIWAQLQLEIVVKSYIMLFIKSDSCKKNELKSRLPNPCQTIYITFYYISFGVYMSILKVYPIFNI